MTPFKTLQIPEAAPYWIRHARVPICFLPGRPTMYVDRDGATLLNLLVDKERIAAGLSPFARHYAHAREQRLCN